MAKIIVLKFVIFFGVIYGLLFLFWRQIETYLSFPALWMDISTTELEDLTSNHEAEKITLTWYNNKELTGIFIDNNEEKTLFFFLPNGGSISTFFNHILEVQELWVNLAVMDYPGYGQSEGFPYEKDVYKSSEIFFDHIKEEKNLSNENIILLWFSIWTAPASYLAKDKDHKLLILFSPFTSRYDIASSLYWFPLQKFLLMENSFNIEKNIQEVETPTMIVYWEKDTLVPPEMSQKVYNKSSANQKESIKVEGAGHNDLFRYLVQNFGNDFDNFLQKLNRN